MTKKLRHYSLLNNNTLKPNFQLVLKSFLLILGVFNVLSAPAQFHIGTDIHLAAGGNLHIAVAETIFEQGIISAAREANYGRVSFAAGSEWKRADHNTHVDGFVRMYGEELFSFPTGNEGILQTVQIQRIDQSSPVDMRFTNRAHTNLEAELGIAQVSDQFYWELLGENPAYVALSWSAFSNLDKLTDNNINRLGMAGYDGTQWRTIEAELDESNFHDNSPSTLLSGSIRSKNPINLEGYTALTLVRMGETGSAVAVSQGFTPNGDGINDTWFIEDIDQFPNAHIIVYSRWEQVVFESKGGYKNDWDGVYQNNSAPLPDGSYAYVIDLEGDGIMDQSGWIYITR
jgi:gliding motility-associated-like protein